MGDICLAVMTYIKIDPTNNQQAARGSSKLETLLVPSRSSC